MVLPNTYPYYTYYLGKGIALDANSAIIGADQGFSMGGNVYYFDNYFNLPPGDPVIALQGWYANIPTNIDEPLQISYQIGHGYELRIENFQKSKLLHLPS